MLLKEYACLWYFSLSNKFVTSLTGDFALLYFCSPLHIANVSYIKCVIKYFFASYLLVEAQWWMLWGQRFYLRDVDIFPWYLESCIILAFKNTLVGCSLHGSSLTNLTWIHEDVDLIPGLAQWVKNPVLLWLWCRLAATVPIRPLNWELAYTLGVDLKKSQKNPPKNPNQRKQ